MTRRPRFAPAALALLCLTLGAAPWQARKSFRQMVIQRVRTTAQVYRRLTGVRGPSTPHGADLVALALGTQRERVLWNCGDCSWPVFLEGTGVAVLKPDGVWLVPADGGAPARRVAADSIVTLLDPLPPGQRVLALVANRGADARDCRYRLRLVDLASGGLAPVPDSLEECERSQAPARAGQFRGGRALDTSTGRPRYVKISQPLAADDTMPVWSPLSPALRAAPDGMERGGAVWGGDDEVIYVRRKYP